MSEKPKDQRVSKISLSLIRSALSLIDTNETSRSALSQTLSQSQYPYAHLTDKDIAELSDKYTCVPTDRLVDLQNNRPLCDL